MMRHLERFLTTRHMLIGLSLFRIIIGTGFLFHLLQHWSERHLLWDAKGLYTYDEFLKETEGQGIYTLFHLSGEPWLLEVIYHGGILVTILFVLGFHTRLTSVLAFLIYVAIYFRNPEITNAGDNIVRLEWFFLLFTHSGAYFSWDRYRRQALPQTNNWLQPFAAVLHNFALLAMILQLLWMYFSAGIYKTMGSLWQAGTAVYYVMRVQDYMWPGVNPILWESDWIIVILTYTTVLFQLAFPFLLLNRYSKYVAVTGAILFHTGIGLIMNLFLFSWYMIGCETLLLTDRDYRRLGHRLRQWGNGISGWVKQRGRKIVERKSTKINSHS
ncbi:HTTM domain-containing protein [Kroppenstedtia pulmonis]|uniref:HTTM domain-containing protein n=1 Tax=Kroppenstedtia pulmonis TaxID=1380685 RepID=A0A7D4CDG9_9BACL|nr:HTTM domain-containing protein [Kroppenstedtia pulmonis]QKG83394.1 HTTM domain-containing protein [Kroppenstedtia pulmonis]